MIRQTIGVLFFAVAALSITGAAAQTYPVKPVRIIIGFPAGTASDLGARVLSKHMQSVVGQPFVVESRPGAQGVIGGNVVVKSEADGYTLYFGPVANLHPVFTKNNPIDAGKDFAPVSDSMYAPYVLFTSSKLPVQTFSELVSLAKASPSGSLNMGLTIAQQELLMQVIKSVAGITYTSVPFTNSLQFMPLLASGEIALHINLFGNFQAPLQAGTVRALFVTAPKRSSQYPNVPTAAEVGISGVDSAGFLAGFWAPKGTPVIITDKLSAAAAAAARTPEAIEQFRKLGYDAIGSTSEEQLKAFEIATQFWSKAAKTGNFQPQ